MIVKNIYDLYSVLIVKQKLNKSVTHEKNNRLYSFGIAWGNRDTEFCRERFPECVL